MRIPALVLGLILPLVMAFSAALVIQAGIQMDSVNDLRTKDYFQTSAFSNDFYTKISTILNGISAREILDQCDSFADGKKSAHEQRFSVVRRTGSLIGGMTG